MSDDRGSEQGRGSVQRAPKTRSRASSKAKGAREELGPGRRQELARQIEAKRYRGKPPSI
jgi:hypothetical protein